MWSGERHWFDSSHIRAIQDHRFHSDNFDRIPLKAPLPERTHGGSIDCVLDLNIDS